MSFLAAPWSHPLEKARLLYPGIALCVVLALAGSFLAEHYHAPALLLVLLLGFGFANQGQDARVQPGLSFCSRQILRLAVALLGARIGSEQLFAVGAVPVAMVLISVPMIIGSALLLGRWLQLPTLQSLVAGFAVAICGVSAAVAIAAAIPSGRLDERRLLTIVVGVTALGTLSMLLYPPLLSSLGYSELEQGLLLGASIHDVAQAAGAGYMVSDTAGDAATLTKLLRVALLAPLIVLVSFWLRKEDSQKTEFPLFLLGFIALFALNSFGLLAESLRQFLISASNVLLLVTMASLGMKTTVASLLKQGWRPLLLLTILSLGLLGLAMSVLQVIS